MYMYMKVGMGKDVYACVRACESDFDFDIINNLSNANYERGNTPTPLPFLYGTRNMRDS